MSDERIDKFANGSAVALYGDAKKHDGRRALGPIVKKFIAAGLAVCIAVGAAQGLSANKEKDSSFLLPNNSEMVHITSSMLSTYEMQAMEIAKESEQSIKAAGHQVCFYVTHEMPGISYYVVEASPCSNMDDFNRSLGNTPEEREQKVAYANQLSAEIEIGGPTDFLTNNLKKPLEDGIFIKMSPLHANVVMSKLNNEVAVEHNIYVSAHLKP